MCPSGFTTFISSKLIVTGTSVFLSSGQINLTSISSPTDLPRMFKIKIQYQMLEEFRLNTLSHNTSTNHELQLRL